MDNSLKKTTYTIPQRNGQANPLTARTDPKSSRARGKGVLSHWRKPPFHTSVSLPSPILQARRNLGPMGE